MRSLPRQYARTRRFSLGVPHTFTVSPDGRRVVFLRSRAGDDPATCLWSYDVEAGEERLLIDPGETDEDLPAEERVRRERTREQASGITAYAADRDARVAAYALSGRLRMTDLLSGRTWEPPAAAGVVAPRPDPAGSTVAYVAGGALRVIGADGTGDRALAAPEGPEVTYGLPEHVAAESMGRHRGYWWAPDGSRLLVARVDTSPVDRWYVADAGDPTAPPVELAYPAVGTANAEVTLWIVGLDGRRVGVEWDRAAFEYVTAAFWGSAGLLVAVQSRDQRTLRVLSVDPETGATRVRREDTDPYWVQIVPGVPAFTDAGTFVWIADVDGRRRLLVDGAPVSPPGLNVREVLSVDGETVLFTASDEPVEVGVWSWSPGEGAVTLDASPGVHTGCLAGGTSIVVSESLDDDGVRVRVRRDGRPPAAIVSRAERPLVRPRVELLRAGERELRTAVLLPSGHPPGEKVPVLLDPYGGAAEQRVLAARSRFLVSQWFADQGFAVVVADGRGTPGRGPDWERSVYGDRATVVLDDQIAALHAVAQGNPDLDLERVGIRGWSFGGYLAALAVLRRPDVFHAAVAGAPVTDLRLYDTHWNERFLGHPDEAPAAYDRAGLLGDAARLRRPLMLIHGLADDNVVAAHTLRLSAALTAAGRPHTLLPLSGVTHMTPQESVAENLLLLQAGFLSKALNGRAQERPGAVRG